eukprot:scpid102570/ scgid0966/ 
MTSSLSKLTSITNNVLAASANAERKSSDTVATFLSRLQVTVNRRLDQRFGAIHHNHTVYESYIQSSNTRAASQQQTLGQLQTKFESSERNLRQDLSTVKSSLRSSERNSANLRQDLSAVKSRLRYLGTGCNLRTLGYKYQSRHSIYKDLDEGQITSVTFRKK